MSATRYGIALYTAGELLQDREKRSGCVAFMFRLRIVPGSRKRAACVRLKFTQKTAFVRAGDKDIKERAYNAEKRLNSRKFSRFNYVLIRCLFPVYHNPKQKDDNSGARCVFHNFADCVQDRR